MQGNSFTKWIFKAESSEGIETHIDQYSLNDLRAINSAAIALLCSVSCSSIRDIMVMNDECWWIYVCTLEGWLNWSLRLQRIHSTKTNTQILSMRVWVIVFMYKLFLCRLFACKVKKANAKQCANLHREGNRTEHNTTQTAWSTLWLLAEATAYSTAILLSI